MESGATTSQDEQPHGVVVAVSVDDSHRFSKTPRRQIMLLTGLGVEGDAHLGVTVQHRSRVRRDPTQPNLRQVHLLEAEFLDSVADDGHVVHPGDLGENVLVRGLDLLALPAGTLLRLGDDATVRVTGLRNPCLQIDAFQPGLLRLAVDRDDDGTVVRRAGVMGVVERAGVVRPGDGVQARLPAPPHQPLQPV